jgi:hypothetical protein
VQHHAEFYSFSLKGPDLSEGEEGGRGDAGARGGGGDWVSSGISGGISGARYLRIVAVAREGGAPGEGEGTSGGKVPCLVEGGSGSGNRGANEGEGRVLRLLEVKVWALEVWNCDDHCREGVCAHASGRYLCMYLCMYIFMYVCNLQDMRVMCMYVIYKICA